jgi:cell division protein FtsZ
MNFEASELASAGPARESSISLCGVGRAGARLVRQLAGSFSGTIWTVDTETEAKGSAPEGIGRVELGERTTRGLGCGGDAAYAQRIAEAEVARIQPRLGPGLLVLVAGIGGGVGAGISPVVARLAREAGAIVVAVVVEPYEFEGGLRQRNAEQCLITLQGACDAVIRVSNQAVARLTPELTAIQALMDLADRHVVGVIGGMLGLLHRSSLVPVGLAELERWARGRQAQGVAAFAEAEGAERIQRVWEDLLQHPFLQPSVRLTDAGGTLVHVVGGSDLRMDELEWLQKELSQWCPRAQILLGAGIDSDSSGTVRVFLLAVRDGVGLPLPPSAPGLETAGGRPAPAPIKTLLFEDTPPAGDSRIGGLDLNAESREARNRSAQAARKVQQQQFNFIPPWTGRFDSAEGTLHQGENLDEPTFVRRGVKLN